MLITLTVAMRNRVVALLWLGLIPAQLAPAALARPPGQPQNTKLLERTSPGHWRLREEHAL